MWAKTKGNIAKMLKEISNVSNSKAKFPAKINGWIVDAANVLMPIG